MENKKIRHSLNKLISRSNDLDKFKKITPRTINTLLASGMADREVKHCNLLAFILNPKSNHHQRGTFLKIFFEDFLSKNPDCGLDLCSTFFLDYDEASVTTEYRIRNKSIDIIISIPRTSYSEKNKKPLNIIIEAKINSAEGKNQTNSYKEIIDEHFFDGDNIFIYICKPSASPPESESFYIYTWHSIYKLLKVFNENSESKKFKDLIDDYCELIEIKDMIESEERQQLIEIAKKFYSENQDAIDFIMDVAGSSQDKFIEISETISEINKNSMDINRDACNASVFRFSTKTVDNYFKGKNGSLYKTGESWTRTQRTAMFEVTSSLDKNENKIYHIHFKVGPLASEKRDDIIRSMRKELKNKSDFIGRVYASITSIKINSENSEIKQIVEKFIREIERAIENLAKNNILEKSS